MAQARANADAVCATGTEKRGEDPNGLMSRLVPVFRVLGASRRKTGSRRRLTSHPHQVSRVGPAPQTCLRSAVRAG